MTTKQTKIFHGAAGEFAAVDFRVLDGGDERSVVRRKDELPGRFPQPVTVSTHAEALALVAAIGAALADEDKDEEIRRKADDDKRRQHDLALEADAKRKDDARKAGEAAEAEELAKKKSQPPRQ